jgi:hypothetical protein
MFFEKIFITFNVSIFYLIISLSYIHRKIPIKYYTKIDVRLYAKVIMSSSFPHWISREFWPKELY